MPPLLRRNTIRLFEASLDALHMAIANLGSMKRIEYREPSAQYAPEIGLIGTSAELAMGACLVQAGSNKALIIATKQHFKSFAQIRDEFRGLLRNSPPSSDFLFRDIGDVAQHRAKLLDFTTQFARLGTVRASGLHGGYGLPHETTVIQANLVADFMETLGCSSRIRPYLSQIPRCMLYDKDRTLFVEDLVKRLDDAEEDDQIRILTSLYLVLPDVPDDEPEWIDAFSRITIAPRKRDIAFLISVLEKALPASLRRTSKAGRGIPVVVKPDDPTALPIAPQHLRSHFNSFRERWDADVGNANGRLEAGFIDLPPLEAVREAFAIGLQEADVLDTNNRFTPHRAWPFIAASLNTQNRTTTPGPYWFIVRHVDDLGQLKALLTKVSVIGRLGLKHHVEECLVGLDAIQQNQPIAYSSSRFKILVDAVKIADKNRGGLTSNIERSKGTARALPESLEVKIEGIVEDRFSINVVLNEIFDTGLSPEATRYWASVLAQASSDLDDVPSLVKILQREDLIPCHTSARKAIRRIDFRLFGPPIEVQE